MLDLLDHHAKSAEQANELARAKLHEAVDAMRGFIHRRDVGWLYREGETIFLTGGMSWGDTPTELYRVFDLLGLTGLDESAAAQTRRRRALGRHKRHHHRHSTPQVRGEPCSTRSSTCGRNGATSRKAASGYPYCGGLLLDPGNLEVDSAHAWCHVTCPRLPGRVV
ncbi:MAG: hypothetical protein M5U25_16255 [Planctomycetota bacterium]|nr:hypothetical protein [Planctomycetota bacterium]